MDGLRQYVVSVTAAAIVCGIVLGLLPKSGSHGMLKMLCGLFLAFTVMDPITKIDIGALISNMTMSYRADAQTDVTFGEDIARDSLEEIIKMQTEAYILDKAKALDVTLEVDVTLSSHDSPVPVAVIIRGSASPYGKEQLARLIAEDLGIAKENQQWIG